MSAARGRDDVTSRSGRRRLPDRRVRVCGQRDAMAATGAGREKVFFNLLGVRLDGLCEIVSGTCCPG